MTFIPLNQKPRGPHVDREVWLKERLEQAVAGLIGAADVVIDLAPVPEEFALAERVVELQEFLKGWLGEEGLPE